VTLGLLNVGTGLRLARQLTNVIVVFDVIIFTEFLLCVFIAYRHHASGSLRQKYPHYELVNQDSLNDDDAGNREQSSIRDEDKRGD